MSLEGDPDLNRRILHHLSDFESPHSQIREYVLLCHASKDMTILALQTSSTRPDWFSLMILVIRRSVNYHEEPTRNEETYS